MVDSKVTSGAAQPDQDSKPPDRTPAFSDFLRVFSYATKWDFFIYVVASAASIGAGITMPLMNVIFGQLVGQFSNYVGNLSNTSQPDFQTLLNRQALYIMALFIGRWVLSSINKFCFRMIGIRLSSAVRHHYLRSLLAQSIHVLDSMPAGAPATAITTTSNTLQLGISERLGTFLTSVSTIVAALIVAFTWSWDLTLVTSSLVLYMLVVLCIVVPLVLKGQAEMVKADTKGNAVASEALGGIRLVMACGAQDRVVSRYVRWVNEGRIAGQKIAPVVGVQLGLVYFGIFGAFGLAFWYGTQRYIAGAISNAGVVIVVLMSVMMIFTSMGQISQPIMAITKAVVAACEFFAVIDAPLPTSGSSRPDISGQDIVLNNVAFEYPSRPGEKVLDDLSFRIPSGKNIALVGPSGSGKSTIVGLLERWYSLRPQQMLPSVAQSKTAEKQAEETSEKPSGDSTRVTKLNHSGSITIGDYDLEDLDLHWWRRQIGLVQQEPFLFNDTIFGNVANGLIGTQWADEPETKKRELVQEACQEANAHEFVSRLPNGYDTKVGDGGMKLSGGQKQRIAIARSIVKKPGIIILDEATSAIDAKSERLVQAALDRVTQNRTTITIAHRLSTIKKADQIIVLQNGRAVEQGTHQSLMTNPAGVYSGLVRAQSLHLSPSDDADIDPTTAKSNIEAEHTVSGYESPVSSETASVQQAEEVNQSRGFIQSFGWLLYEQRAQWPSYLGVVFSSMVVASGTPLQAWLFAKVITVFILSGNDIKREANFWALMWLALATYVGLAYFAEGWISLRLQYFISATYKMHYFTDILYQKIPYFDQDSNSHGALSSRVSGDAKSLEELLGINLATLLSGIWTVVGCIIISLIFGWKLGLIATFLTMPIMLSTGFWKYRHEVYFDQMNSAVFLESSQFATEAIGAMRTVSSLSMEASINNRYQELLHGHVKTARRKAQWTSVLYGFAESITLGCQALLFWYGGRLLASGEYTLESFFVCFMAAINGAESAGQVLSIAPSAAQAKAAANRILEVHESAHIDRSGSKSSSMIPDMEGGVKINLDNVTFQYPTRDVLVFEKLKISIEKGQYAAFVGPSGCGKTTIISLLERFYELESNKGTILCNNINVQDVDVYDYRQMLSLVPQEPILFQGTVRDNILFGVADPSSVSDDRIHQVCRDAFIHDFIISLPEGYATDVGQKGVSLSGGQKQRIAIARALIRDPKILLLDEATSALDSESEKIVLNAFERARAGRTMISVAHRLSTIQNADIIFVFDKGEVLEKGTHNELLKRQGIYWEMCQNQALDQ